MPRARAPRQPPPPRCRRCRARGGGGAARLCRPVSAARPATPTSPPTRRAPRPLPAPAAACRSSGSGSGRGGPGRPPRSRRARRSCGSASNRRRAGARAGPASRPRCRSRRRRDAPCRGRRRAGRPRSARTAPILPARPRAPPTGRRAAPARRSGPAGRGTGCRGRTSAARAAAATAGSQASSTSKRPISPGRRPASISAVAMPQCMFDPAALRTTGPPAPLEDAGDHRGGGRLPVRGGEEGAARLEAAAEVTDRVLVEPQQHPAGQGRPAAAAEAAAHRPHEPGQRQLQRAASGGFRRHDHAQRSLVHRHLERQLGDRVAVGVHRERAVGDDLHHLARLELSRKGCPRARP